MLVGPGMVNMDTNFLWKKTKAVMEGTGRRANAPGKGPPLFSGARNKISKSIVPPVSQNQWLIAIWLVVSNNFW